MQVELEAFNVVFQVFFQENAVREYGRETAISAFRHPVVRRKGSGRHRFDIDQFSRVKPSEHEIADIPG